MQVLGLLTLSGAASAGVAGSRKLKHDHIAEALPPYKPPTIEVKLSTLTNVAQQLAHDAQKALSADAPFKNQQDRTAFHHGLLTEYEHLAVANDLDPTTSSNPAGSWSEITYGLTDVISNAQMHWEVATESIRSRTSEAVELAKAQLTASDRPWPSRASTPHDILRRPGEDITAKMILNDINGPIEQNTNANGYVEYPARNDDEHDTQAKHPAPLPLPKAGRFAGVQASPETRSADPTPAPTISMGEARTVPLTAAVAAKATPDASYQRAGQDYSKAGYPAPAPNLSAIRTGF